MINLLNKVSLKNTIILSKRSNSQLFNLMVGELNLLKEKYKDKFDYLVLDENIFNKFFYSGNNSYPKMVIVEKNNSVINIEGFRHFDYIVNILDKIKKI